MTSSAGGKNFERLRFVLSRLDPVRQSGSGWSARCPSHDDRVASLSVACGDDGRVLLRCHAGCDLDAIVSALGLVLQDLFPAKDTPPSKPDAVYRYTEEDGNLLYEVLRYPEKKFLQRRPDGAGDFIWNLGGTRRVLFRLKNLLASPKQALVWIAEGEKDVLTLEHLGKLATCNSGGAGKWRSDHAEALSGRDVVIFSDQDDPGLRHAHDIAQSLLGKARSIRLVDEIIGAHDVSDLRGKILASGGDEGTVRSLLVALANRPEYPAGLDRRWS